MQSSFLAMETKANCIWQEIAEQEHILYIRQDKFHFFQAMGLISVEKILSFSNETTKQNRRKDRDMTIVVSFGINFYIKRCQYLRGWNYVKARLFPKSFQSPAALEVKNYKILEKLNIPTAITVAWGEKRCHGRVLACFIITEELQGTPLQDYLQKCSDQEKQKIGQSIAQVMHQIHSANLYYADLKAKHLYCQTNGTLALLDVARVLPIPFWRSQLDVYAEELANLHQSLSLALIAFPERFQFLMLFREKQDCQNVPSERKLLSKIIAKLRWKAFSKKWRKRLRKLLRMDDL